MVRERHPAGDRVVVCGCGSAVTAPGMENTALLLELAGALIPVDFSGTPAARIAATGRDLLEVRTGVLTHHHVDHLYALPSFVQETWVRLLKGIGVAPGTTMQTHRVDVVTTEAAAEAATKLLDAVGFVGREPMFDLRIHGVAPGPSPVRPAPGWTMDLVAGDHGDMPVHGIVLDGPRDERVVYSGDSEATDELLALAAGADLLIHDCQVAEGPMPGHATAEQLVEAIGRHGTPRRLVPVHLAPIPADESERVHETLERGLPGCEVVLPRDGMSIPLRG